MMKLEAQYWIDREIRGRRQAAIANTITRWLYACSMVAVWYYVGRLAVNYFGG